jgi:haloacetate dehalogenase
MPERERPVREFLAGFERFDLRTGAGIDIHGARAGHGPAILLLHGNPQSHCTWDQVAPRLVQAGYSVVATDLRGYGDSSRPAGGDNHVNYSKREMARDQIEVMRALGHPRFAVIGHDRGGRVAHRMALDFPGSLTHIAVLDIAPTATMYANTDRAFATRYFWWFLLIQPAPLPERLIEGDPEFFLRSHLAAQSRTPGVPSEPLIQEYLRCFRQAGSIHAICEDYRAAASIDLEHDAADAHRRIEIPLLALWGAQGTVGQLYDVIATWREKAAQVAGHALDCGHALQEEAPEQSAAALLEFLR